MTCKKDSTPFNKIIPDKNLPFNICMTSLPFLLSLLYYVDHYFPEEHF